MTGRQWGHTCKVSNLARQKTAVCKNKGFSGCNKQGLPVMNNYCQEDQSCTLSGC